MAWKCGGGGACTPSKSVAVDNHYFGVKSQN